MDWLTQLCNFFTFKQNPQYEVEERSTGRCPFGFGSQSAPESEPEVPSKYPEFDKAIKNFNLNRDLLVVSEEYVKNLDLAYRAKLETFKDVTITFPGDILRNNVAVVTAGYSGRIHG